MSDSLQIDPTDQTATETTTVGEETGDDGVAPPESTVGTGTAMALGCVAGTIVLIGFGLIFLFFATMK